MGLPSSSVPSAERQIGAAWPPSECFHAPRVGRRHSDEPQTLGQQRGSEFPDIERVGNRKPPRRYRVAAQLETTRSSGEFTPIHLTLLPNSFDVGGEQLSVQRRDAISAAPILAIVDDMSLSPQGGSGLSSVSAATAVAASSTRWLPVHHVPGSASASQACRWAAARSERTSRSTMVDTVRQRQPVERAGRRYTNQ